MGTVYRALDRELDDEVAVKVLLPEAFDEGTTVGVTLKQEIRLARKITHRNVVRTHDLGEADGLRFLTMEYVPGTTLRDILDRKGALALSPGLQIAKQLCRGLAAVHEAGIIHRDIKPPNIMVLPNGLVKLMDFGIARTAEGADPATQRRPDRRHAVLHEPRAGGRPRARCAERHLLGRRRPLRAVLRDAAHRRATIPARSCAGTCPSSRSPSRCSGRTCPISWRASSWRASRRTRLQRPPTANDLYGALQRVAV